MKSPMGGTEGRPRRAQPLVTLLLWAVVFATVTVALAYAVHLPGRVVPWDAYSNWIWFSFGGHLVGLAGLIVWVVGRKHQWRPHLGAMMLSWPLGLWLSLPVAGEVWNAGFQEGAWRTILRLAPLTEEITQRYLQDGECPPAPDLKKRDLLNADWGYEPVIDYAILPSEGYSYLRGHEIPCILAIGVDDLGVDTLFWTPSLDHSAFHVLKDPATDSGDGYYRYGDWVLWDT